MMRKFNLISILSTSIYIFSILLLLGCIASKKDQFMEDMMAKDIDPLSGLEIQKLFSSNASAIIFESKIGSTP